MRLKSLFLFPLIGVIGVSVAIQVLGSLLVSLITRRRMWKCRRCDRPVYFAERKTSLGFSWHPECLTCEECGKRLTSGQHADHKGKPYCYIPCYGALFGPQLYGHGSRVESHASFGAKRELSDKMLENKLKEYNHAYDGCARASAVHYRERNGKFILEGSLKIYWDVRSVLQLKQEHDDRAFARRKSSYSLSTSDDDMSASDGCASADRSYRTLPVRRHLIPDQTNETNNTFDDQSAIGESQTDDSEVTLRRKTNLRRSRVKLRRRCSINGHFYNRDTSAFKPAHGCVTSVFISSLVNAPEVINLLLDKFKVTNKAEDFALFILRDNGECKRIQDDEYPLVVRVLLGPNEEAAKVFILNKNKNEIPGEVAQYLRLSTTEMRMFLKKFEEEEEREVNKIKTKYADIKKWIKIRIKEIESTLN